LSPDVRREVVAMVDRGLTPSQDQVIDDTGDAGRQEAAG
jgi:hypothetical protein